MNSWMFDKAAQKEKNSFLKVTTIRWHRRIHQPNGIFPYWRAFFVYLFVSHGAIKTIINQIQTDLLPNITWSTCLDCVAIFIRRYENRLPLSKNKRSLWTEGLECGSSYWQKCQWKETDEIAKGANDSK